MLARRALVCRISSGPEGARVGGVVERGVGVWGGLGLAGGRWRFGGGWVVGRRVCLSLGEEGRRRLAVRVLSFCMAAALFRAISVCCSEVSRGAGSGPGGVRLVVGAGGVVYVGGVGRGGGCGVHGGGGGERSALVWACCLGGVRGGGGGVCAQVSGW